jgi:hypothetical protein
MRPFSFSAWESCGRPRAYGSVLRIRKTDRDMAMQQEVKNVAHTVASAVSELRVGRLSVPDAEVKNLSLSPARVMFGVQFLQALARHMRINLRGRNIGMPEQELHYAQIRAVIQQMRRERMPQRVRR